MALDSKTLVDSFNASAADYRVGNLPASMLVSKYQALFRYKAETEENKAQLTAAMFNAVVETVRTIASPSGKLDTFDIADRVSPLLQQLTADENLGLVPQQAPQVLAELSIALADRVGKVTGKTLKDAGVYEGYIDNYRGAGTKLAAMLVEYADKFDSSVAQRTAPPPVKAQKFTQ